jgi:lactate dehydrogenase-like 2-hydroxyacid dehydrogenase
MKAFIFEPLWDELVTPELIADLQDAGITYEVIKETAPLSDHAPLFEGEEKRLLYLNPDYVNWKLKVEDYKDIPNLKGIFGAATSFTWIDMSYASEHGIPVCNIKGFSAEAVAEWAIMMMLNVARKTPRIIKDGCPLDFGKDFMKYRGIELHGKIAGIIGLGRIGTAIANRCKGLGMNIVYWSKNSRSEEFTFMELEQLMKEADVIFPIMAVNEESKRLITTEMLKSMKPTAILIDETHDLFDQETVLGMVRESALFGFGFEAGPKTFNSYDGNVWAAPAYGWATDNSMYASVKMQIDNMVAATHGEFPNKVN